ncbi:MAG: LamG domain-containing protein [Pirellulaceae bacterium]|nr:LamG domain-containing protein [Planctomycetales bacterium]
MPIRFRVTVATSILGTILCARFAFAAQVVQWSLDEGAGETASSLFNSPDADAILLGQVGWIDNLLPPVPTGTSSAVMLDPSQDNAFLQTDAHTGVAGDGARSIAAWLRTGDSGNLTIVNWGEQATGARFTFRVNHDASGTPGALRLEVAGGFAIGNTIVNDNQWHHVAVTLPAGGSVDDVKLYVDGQLDADINNFSGLLDTTINTTGSLIRAGARENPPAANFVGMLDDVRIWDEELSSSAVAALVPAGPLPRISFEVNRDTGNIRLANDYGQTIDGVIGYSLKSRVGGLDVAAWQTVSDNADASSGGSFDSDDDWIVLTDTVNPSGHDLSELGAGGDGGALADGATLGLGNVWSKSPFEDVAAELLFANGDKLPIAVQYVGNNGNPFPLGDLTFDGIVNNGDWAIFRGNLLTEFPLLSTAAGYARGDFDADGDNDRDDYAAFKRIYDAANGAGSFAAMVATVPEPATGVLLFGPALLAGVVIRRRRGFRFGSCS